MKQFIHSKTLEEKLANIDNYKVINIIYRKYMKKYKAMTCKVATIPNDADIAFSIYVAKVAGITKDIAREKISEQLSYDSVAPEQINPYYYTDIETNKFFVRYCFTAPNEQILLDIFMDLDKFLVLA